MEKFDLELFNNTLVDWNYKKVSVNGVCLYSHNNDVSTTLNEFRDKVKKVEKEVQLYWTEFIVKPYDNGVSLEFKINMDFRWETK